MSEDGIWNASGQKKGRFGIGIVSSLLSAISMSRSSKSIPTDSKDDEADEEIETEGIACEDTAEEKSSEVTGESETEEEPVAESEASEEPEEAEEEQEEAPEAAVEAEEPVEVAAESEDEAAPVAVDSDVTSDA